MRLVVDMNLSPEWVGFLGGLGYEVDHWSHVGNHSAADTEILGWARKRGATVLTNDLDFGRILALTAAVGPSVVQIRNDDLLPDAIGEDVVAVLRAHEDDLNRGALVVLDESSRRVRILPIMRG